MEQVIEQAMAQDRVLPRNMALRTDPRRLTWEAVCSTTEPLPSE
jgi:hypothetical protein